MRIHADLTAPSCQSAVGAAAASSEPITTTAAAAPASSRLTILPNRHLRAVCPPTHCEFAHYQKALTEMAKEKFHLAQVIKM